MALKTGSIILGTIRYFTGIVPLRGRYTIQMLSTNLSGNTIWNLQVSVDGTSWENAKELGTDISDTLVDDLVQVRTFEGNPGDKFKILFDGATTGTVTYKLNI